VAIRQIESRFKKLGPYEKPELIRDLITLVEELNLQLTSAQTQIDELKARLTAAGIP
jgi:hypothetical protein